MSISGNNDPDGVLEITTNGHNPSDIGILSLPLNSMGEPHITYFYPASYLIECRYISFN